MSLMGLLFYLTTLKRLVMISKFNSQKKDEFFGRNEMS